MLRQTVQTQEMKRLVDRCYTRYREGFVTHVQKGKVPSQYQSLASYVAQYVVSPPISRGCLHFNCSSGWDTRI